jgi:hypothetical protein
MNVINNVRRLYLPGPHLDWWGAAVSPLPTRAPAPIWVRLPNKGQQGDLTNPSETLACARAGDADLRRRPYQRELH